MRAGPPTLLPLFAALILGCGRTMTEEDCHKVGENMLAAWELEAKKAQPPEGTTADKAFGVLKSEQQKLASEWAAECKKELVGRRVDKQEMDCLLASKTLDQISKCAER